MLSRLFATGLDTRQVPIFPLHAVLYPGGKLPLRVFEPRYMDMAKECLSENRPFGICLIREGEETGTPAVPEEIGCLANIVDWDMEQLGVLSLKVVGGERFRIIDHDVSAGGLIQGQIVTVRGEPAQLLPPSLRICATVLQHIVAEVGEEHFAPPFEFDNAVWVGYRLAEVLPLKLIAKQKMLEMNDSVTRVRVLHKFLIAQGLSA